MELLVEKKKEILERCLNYIFNTYPPESSQFMKQEKDRFLNPIGCTIRNEMEHIFNELIGTMDQDKLSDSLENIIKIRAVQDFPPSEAVSFVSFLKKAIWEELNIPDTGYRISDKSKTTIEDLSELEKRIDRIALLAFDIYTRCREKIHEIKLKGIKVIHGRE